MAVTTHSIETHWGSLRLTETHWDSFRLIETHSGSLRLIETHQDWLRLINNKKLKGDNLTLLAIMMMIMMMMIMMIMIMMMTKSHFLKRSSFAGERLINTWCIVINFLKSNFSKYKKTQKKCSEDEWNKIRIQFFTFDIFFSTFQSGKKTFFSTC